MIFDGWRRRVVRRLPRSTRWLLELAPARGTSPDFLTPGARTLEEGLALIRSTPAERIRAELARTARRGGEADPRTAALVEGDERALAALVATLRDYHRSALAPYWPRIQAQVHTDLATRGQLLLHEGVDGTLAGLLPGSRWRPPVLELPYPVDRELRLDGRGLRLLPSLFCWRRPVTLVDPARPPVLVLPAGPDPGWLSAASPAPTHRSLAALLGRTRAVVLTTIAAQAATTTQIARRTGVSVAAASQHATVLREAGLIATQRRGNRSIHSVTPAATKLIGGAAPDPS
ncbi:MULTISPECIES: ArsR/SmtB family transcription factor [Actinomadura]|uniref:Helix-turn-helix domain-containing protein n=1 Tax=Actinomadura yumaensis TaxID=111807 RepID=A0ABW2CEX0_9ACTN|nr:helix-turn-helix domain-containing protein [Actinomadura sp. J1-007]